MRQKISGKLHKRNQSKKEFIKISKQAILTTGLLLSVLLGLKYLLISEVEYVAVKAPEQPKIALVEPVVVKDIPTMVQEVASQNGANPTLMKKIAFCESSYRPEAVGDGGRAKNIFQFHKPTFDEFEAKYGEDLNYNSAYDQTKLASKMVRDGKGYHWTCFKKVV